jgi:putative DNA primase/helicase
VNVDAIPLELRTLPRWIVWRWGDLDPRTGKRKKPPYRADAPDGPRHASNKKRADWATFETAVTVVEAGKADGIGFALEPPYVGVDLDSDLPEADQGAIMAVLDSYAESSPSGVGYHVVIRANLNGHGRHPAGIGVFQTERFFYFTGRHVKGTPRTIEERQAELDKVLAEFLPEAPPTSIHVVATPVDLDDQELLERAFVAENGTKFGDLWEGRWESRYPSQSEADLALCNMLAFWTGRDPDRIDSLFRSSGLYREKWERADYRSSRVDLAIANCGDVYEPRAADDKDDDFDWGEIDETPPPDETLAPDPDVPRDDPTVTLAEFAATRDESAQLALITTAEQGAIMAAAGLTLFVAKGHGKTTFLVDFGLNLAAGESYCGLTILRPLRMLLVENEGPREAFREEVEARLPHGPQPGLGGCFRIWDEPAKWGTIKVSVEEQRTRLRTSIEEHRVDLVVSDSLTRFGMRGNGTPEETREFVDWLAEIGLGRDVGFLLLHHPLTRPDPSLDELDKIAGAWHPHCDLILTLRRLAGNRARLTFAKTRWAHGERPDSILAFDPDAETFEFVCEDIDEERDLVAELAEVMANGDWYVVSKLREPKAKGGVGAREEAIETALTHERFETAPGEAIGRRKGTTYYRLKSPTEAVVGVV